MARSSFLKMKRTRTGAGFRQRTGARPGVQRGGWGKQEVGTWTRGPKYPVHYGGSEMKYFDSERTANAIGSSTDWTATEQDPATLNTLFVPIKGTGINNRIGRKVVVHKVKVRGLIKIDAQADQTAGDASSLMRVALVQDTQTNGAQAQGEQIFQDPTAASGNNAVLSFQSLDNLGRFRVLQDKFIQMGDPNLTFDGTNVEQNGLVRKFQFFHSFKTPIVVNFNATNGGTVADIVDNSWHVIANANTSALSPDIVYQCRVSYKDL